MNPQRAKIPTAASATDELLRLIRLHAYEEREVTLRSGRKSNFYVDCKQAVLRADGHFLTGVVMLEALREHCPDVEAVGGLTMGADPLVSAVSTVSWVMGHPIHGFYIRKEPKAHGTQQWVEGAKTLDRGCRVVILEDVCTTGTSAITAAERARDAGMDVRMILALVDREEGGSEEIAKHALRFESVFTKTNIMESLEW